MSSTMNQICCSNRKRGSLIARAVSSAFAIAAVTLPLACLAQGLPGGVGIPGQGPGSCTTMNPSDPNYCGTVMTLPREKESIGNADTSIYTSQQSSVSSMAAKIQQGMSGGGGVPAPNNYHGNSKFDDLWSKDLDKVKDDFDSCQLDDNQHTLDDLTDWIYPFIEAIISEITGWGDNNYVIPDCISHYGYSGPVIGSCWQAHKEDCNPPFDWTICGCVYGASWTAYDLIEYYYPTGRVNVSEQPFQSTYIQTQDYTDGVKFMQNTGYKEIGDNMQTAVTNLQQAVTKGAQKMANINLPAGPAWNNTDTQIEQAVVAKIKSYPVGSAGDPRLRNSANGYMESRYYPEDEVSGVAGGILGFLFIPHYPKYKTDHSNKLITDPGGKAWEESLILSKNNMDYDQGRWGPYFDSPPSAQGANCVENNMFSLGGQLGVGQVGSLAGLQPQKTPSLLMPGLTMNTDELMHHDIADLTADEMTDGISPLNDPNFIPYVKQTANVCLNNVGEVFPYTHFARLHPTDKVYSAALKIAQFSDTQDMFISRGLDDNVLFTLAGITPYHTFVHQWDKFQLLHDDGFANGGLAGVIGKACAPMEQKLASIGGMGGGAGGGGGGGGMTGMDATAGGTGSSSSSDYIAQRNVDVKPSVVSAVTGASEATFEVFSLFKGCYAGPSFAMDDIALPHHGETQMDWGMTPRSDCTQVTEGNCWQDEGKTDQKHVNKGTMRTH